MTTLALDRPAARPGLDPLSGFAQLAGAYLSGYASQLTVNAYRADLRDWLAFCERHGLDPLDAQRHHVDLYARSLEDAGRSTATVARRLSTLSGLYGYAVAEGVLPASPVANVKRPRVSHSPNLGPDAASLRALLATAEAAGPRDHALVLLLGVMGLRVSEACAATVDDLGSERGHRTLSIVRKGNKPATVPLPPVVAAAVDACLAGRQEGTLLGVNQAGKPFGRDDAARALRRLCRRAAIAPVSPHALRHAAATQLLALGVELHRVQDALGHSDPRTTRRYDDARQALDGHASYALADALSGTTRGGSAATATATVRFTTGAQSDLSAG